MKYRLLYKRFAETAQKFLLVEDVIEADTFDVRDGCLVFVSFDEANDQHRRIMALPPTMWIHVEPETANPLVESGKPGGLSL